MGKPLLQIALDAQYLETALVDVKQIEHNIDIIEVGTILACSEECVQCEYYVRYILIKFLFAILKQQMQVLL